MANPSRESTTNYNLSLYIDGDSPDLTVEYLEAMDKIDELMKAANDAIDALEASVKQLQTDLDAVEAAIAKASTDASITVEDLAGAKVNVSGYVYAE